VLDGQLVGHRFGAVSLVEAIAQDGQHRSVGTGADVHAALASCQSALNRGSSATSVQLAVMRRGAGEP